MGRDTHKEYLRYYPHGSEAYARKIEKQRIRSASLRQRIVELFGSMCARCGFSDIRALQLDHVKSNPRLLCKYRSGRDLYRLILNGTLAKEHFQILCANCNTIKRMETPAESTRKRKAD